MKALLLVLALSRIEGLLLLPQSDPVVDRIVREAQEGSQVMRHLDHLTNKIGPRLTSSTRLTQACEWTRSEFEKWGLKARLEEWGTYPVGFDRGPWSGRMNEPEEMELTIGTNAWMPGTNGPVKGHAVLAPATDDERDRVKPSLKGAWVISATRGPEKYQKDYDEAGIAGVIRTAPRELILTGGRSPSRWEDLPTRVVVSMVASQHQKIAAFLKEGKKVVLTIDLKNEFKQGPIKVYNVIADLVGSEKPDEYVVVGGHIDSWDGATGATDNGTGVSTTLEAARLLSKAGAKPKRTIRFMLWSGEEQGLLGSRAWIKAHPEELRKISAVLVHDGGTNYVSGISATEAIAPHFEKVFAPFLNLDAEMKFRINRVKGLPRGIGSDHDAFLGAGVPGFFWQQSKTATKGQTYTREHHTQHDVYAAAIPEFQRHTSMVVAVGAWGIANLEALLPRDGLTSAPAAAPGGDRRILGVQCEDDLTVLDVSPGSPAERGGVKVGDRILRISGQALPDMGKLREEIQKSPLQTKVVVLREGKELELAVTFPK